MRSFAMNLLASGSLIAASSMRFDTGSFASLADLAEMNTDEIKALESRLFPAGLFAVKVTAATAGMNPPKEGLNPETGEPWEPLFYFEFKFEILEANPLDKTIEAESLVGRTITQRTTLWPKSFNEEIGLVKGNYQRVGLDTTGRLGGMEGGEPGWLDGAIEHIIPLKVTHGRPNPETGAQRANFFWMKIENQNGGDANA